MEISQVEAIQSSELKSRPVVIGQFDVSPDSIPGTEVGVLSQSYEKIFPLNSVIGYANANAM